MKHCRNFKIRNYSKLIIFNLLIVLFNQFIYLSGVIEIVKNIQLRNFCVCIMFIFCSCLSVIVTLFVEKDISSFDLLTGTYTREKMYSDLSKLIKNKKKILVMYIDLNNFKEINDSYGHLEGDRILELFGYTTSNLGKNIKSYRMGGDEFILISEVEERTNRVLSDFIKSERFDFSYGISKFPDDVLECKEIDDIIEKLISISDTKMYERKFSKKVR